MFVTALIFDKRGIINDKGRTATAICRCRRRIPFLHRCECRIRTTGLVDSKIGSRMQKKQKVAERHEPKLPDLQSFGGAPAKKRKYASLSARSWHGLGPELVAAILGDTKLELWA